MVCLPVSSHPSTLPLTNSMNPKGTAWIPKPGDLNQSNLVIFPIVFLCSFIDLITYTLNKKPEMSLSLLRSQIQCTDKFLDVTVFLGLVSSLWTASVLTYSLLVIHTKTEIWERGQIDVFRGNPLIAFFSFSAGPFFLLAIFNKSPHFIQ